jgi:hypothetical protein
MAYPVHFSIDYQERASRLTTFFRLILVIPHLIVLSLWLILAFVLAIVSWFAIVITGRHPRGVFDMQAKFLAYYARVLSYQWLLVDRFPPFGGGSPDDRYPVQVGVEYPERQSRLTVFFRYFMAIPALLVSYALNILLEILGVFAWFAIIFLGRLPRGLFEVMELPVRYQVRLSAYAFLLLTDEYPWFQPESEPTVPERSWNEPLPPIGDPAAE